MISALLRKGELHGRVHELQAALVVSREEELGEVPRPRLGRRGRAQGRAGRLGRSGQGEPAEEGQCDRCERSHGLSAGGRTGSSGWWAYQANQKADTTIGGSCPGRAALTSTVPGSG